MISQFYDFLVLDLILDRFLDIWSNCAPAWVSHGALSAQAVWPYCGALHAALQKPVLTEDSQVSGEETVLESTPVSCFDDLFFRKSELFTYINKTRLDLFFLLKCYQCFDYWYLQNIKLLDFVTVLWSRLFIISVYVYRLLNNISEKFSDGSTYFVVIYFWNCATCDNWLWENLTISGKNIFEISLF